MDDGTPQPTWCYLRDLNLQEVGLDFLIDARDKIEKAIAWHERKNKEKARAILKNKAKELGYELSEFSDISISAKVPVKYINPENPRQKWSGRGRRPLWFKEAIMNGVKPETLQVY